METFLQLEQSAKYTQTTATIPSVVRPRIDSYDELANVFLHLEFILSVNVISAKNIYE